VRAAFFFLVLLASLQAGAQQRGLGIYAGVGVGNFQYEEDHGPLSVVVEDRPLDDIVRSATRTIGLRSVGLDDSELAWKIFGGWNFTNNLGVEVSYARANDLTSTYSEQIGDITVSANLSTNVDIGAARVMGYLPFRLGALFGGVGYFNAQTSSTQSVGLMVSGTGSIQDSIELGGSSTDNGLTAIVGFQWALPILMLRADYELMDMNAGSAATLNVGVSLGF